jgi:hypothetical protein
MLLRRLYYQEHGRPPGAQPVLDAVVQLESMAVFEGSERSVHVRIAASNDKIYLDLGRDDWKVVEVDAAGWRVLADSPVMFRRPKGLAELPLPTGGGSLSDLRRFINVTEQEWPLILGFLVACLNPAGPYPLLILVAEQGSGKSTQARILRALIDPNLSPLRSPPRGERDLMISAVNSWMLAFDNLSRVPPWLSDALCRLATDGGFSTRELYTDSEEVILNAMRPVILTGIDDLATRGDLLDRAIVVTLPRIPDTDRRREREILVDFEQRRPEILGALLDAVVTGLRELPNVAIPSLTRMADFEVWAAACEAGLGLPPGTISATYRLNRSRASSSALDASPLPDALFELARDHLSWEGRATDLLELLDEWVGDEARRRRDWPKSASALSNKLRRLAPNLRDAGLEIEFDRTEKARNIRMRLQDGVSGVSASSTVANVGPGHAHDGAEVTDGNAVEDGSAVSSAVMDSSRSQTLLGLDVVANDGNDGPTLSITGAVPNPGAQVHEDFE